MSAIDSEQLLEWVVAFTIIILITMVVVFVLLLVLRYRHQRQEQRLQAQYAYWQQQLFLACDPNAELQFEPRRLSELKRDPLFLLWLLQRWSQMHQYVRGDADDGLQAFADKLKFERRMLRLMETNTTRRLIACCIALGDMQHLSSAAVMRLVELTDHNSSMVILTALRALMRYNAAMALPLLLKNTHYIAPERLVTVLRECPPKLLTEATCEAILHDTPEHAGYLLRILRGMDIPVSTAFLEQLFKCYHDDVDVIATALSLVQSPQLLPQVRNYLTSNHEPIRIQATAALARFATPTDVEHLWKLVTDKSWWVRYRAAEGLLEQPNAVAAEILERGATLNDDYAYTMLKQVAVEIDYGVL